MCPLGATVVKLTLWPKAPWAEEGWVPSGTPRRVQKGHGLSHRSPPGPLHSARLSLCLAQRGVREYLIYFAMTSEQNVEMKAQ